MVHYSSLRRVGVHIGGIPSVGYRGKLWPDTVVVAFPDISFGPKDGTVACGSVDQDRIWSVAECRAWELKKSARQIWHVFTKPTIFLLQGPEPDVAVFSKSATALRFVVVEQCLYLLSAYANKMGKLSNEPRVVPDIWPRDADTICNKQRSGLSQQSLR